jgi:hypothetical protein
MSKEVSESSDTKKTLRKLLFIEDFFVVNRWWHGKN